MWCPTSQDMLQSGGNMCFIEAFIYCFGSLKGTAGSALLCKILGRFIAFSFYQRLVTVGFPETILLCGGDILKEIEGLSKTILFVLPYCFKTNVYSP